MTNIIKFARRGKTILSDTGYLATQAELLVLNKTLKTSYIQFRIWKIPYHPSAAADKSEGTGNKSNSLFVTVLQLPIKHLFHRCCA